MINEHPPYMTPENALMWKETKLMNRYTEETLVRPALKSDPRYRNEQATFGNIK